MLKDRCYKCKIFYCDNKHCKDCPASFHGDCDCANHMHDSSDCKYFTPLESLANASKEVANDKE